MAWSKSDGKSADKGLLQSWPAGGPKVVWSFKKQVLVTDRLPLLATPSTVSAKMMMASSLPRSTPRGFADQENKLDEGKNEYSQGWGGGPRSTTVDGKQVFALSSDGMLACYDVESLEQKWK